MKKFTDGINVQNPVRCRFCASTVSTRAVYCPHCQQPLSWPRRTWRGFRSLLETVAFLTTATAVWFTGTQVSELRNENKLRMAEQQPYVQPTVVDLERTTDNSVVRINLLNSGLSIASNVRLIFDILADKGSPSEMRFSDTVSLTEIPPKNWYDYRSAMIAHGSIVKQAVMRVKVYWDWKGFARIDSSEYNFFLPRDLGTAVSHGLGLTREQADRYWGRSDR